MSSPVEVWNERPATPRSTTSPTKMASANAACRCATAAQNEGEPGSRPCGTTAEDPRASWSRLARSPCRRAVGADATALSATGARVGWRGADSGGDIWAARSSSVGTLSAGLGGNRLEALSGPLLGLPPRPRQQPARRPLQLLSLVGEIQSWPKSGGGPSRLALPSQHRSWRAAHRAVRDARRRPGRRPRIVGAVASSGAERVVSESRRASRASRANACLEAGALADERCWTLLAA